MSFRIAIPTDPDERRKLWREWVHLDTPSGEVVRPNAPVPAAAARSGVVRRVRLADEEKVTAEPSPETDWLPQVLDAPAGVIFGLRRAVEECLDGDRLPIRDRERLISRALRLGLNRFEANLLIAAVQHRARNARSEAEVAAHRHRRRWSLGTLITAALALELAAIAIYVRFMM